LVRPPQLLLLDEPSVGVDPVSRRELWEIVHVLVGEGMSVLWATAYLDEAERCHDVLLLNDGRLLAAGPPRSFSARVRGRTFALRVESADRRTVLRKIRSLPVVVDAIVKGREIRVLTATGSDADALVQCCREMFGTSFDVKAVEPAFEDAFISLLKDREPADRAANTATAVPRTSHSGEEKRPVSSTAPKFPRIAGDDGDGSSSADTVIEVVGLVRRFGDFTAVGGIDFTVGRGEIFGLLGPNGAGKSTTFKMLCGLLPPSDGKALVLGIDLRRAAAVARSRIGYMAQKFSLYGNMSVVQNLRFFASAYGLDRRTRERRIEQELDEFGLAPYAETVSDTLPLGYKQRLALACAIMHQPGILFLDEPTSGVDPLVRREFWTRINAMAGTGVTVMVTTHFMEEAEYCDRIGIIYRGRLIAMGTPDDLREAHRSEDLANPTLEDAFVSLIKRYDREYPQ
ncbi:MAG: ATP-binding cassette domain-containing protein, partial [Alphaproteobacteria bacterium]